MIEYGMPLIDYLSHPGVSAGDIIRLLKSPLHFRCGEKESTAAMQFGSAFHTALLEPEHFERDYIVWDGGDKRSKAWKEFAAANEGRNIIDTDDRDAITAMVGSVRAHPIAQKYLTDYDESELSIFWTDGDISCKARIDKLISNFIIEIKTTRDPSPAAFIRQAFQLGYHIKAAWYQRAIRAYLGKALRVIVVSVESAPPYDVVVYEIPDYSLDLANTEIETALHIYRKCAATNRWPGISEELQTLDLPKWAYKDDIKQTTLTINGEEVTL